MPRTQINGLLSRVAFSVGVDELEREVSQGGLLEMKDELQQWWQGLREGLLEEEEQEALTPRELKVGVEKFGLEEEHGVQLKTVYNICCAGATIVDPNPKYKEPFLTLTNFVKITRTSGILSNFITFRTVTALFETAGLPFEAGESGTDHEPKRLMSLDHFALLLTHLADLSYGRQGQQSYIETTEKRLIKLLQVHMFPSILQTKAVVGENQALSDIIDSVEIIHITDLAEDFFSIVFLTYANHEEMTPKVALSLAQMQQMYADFKVCPEIITTAELVDIFAATGTKRKRKFPHFLEMIMRTALNAFERSTGDQPRNDAITVLGQPKPVTRVYSLIEYMTRGKAAKLVGKGHIIRGKGVLEALADNVHYMATVVLPDLQTQELQATDHDIGMATISHYLEEHQLVTLAVFEELDTEQSGVVDATEFKELCMRLEVPLSDLQYAASFGYIDHDGDGFVQFAEIQEAIQNYNRLEFAHMVHHREDLTPEEIKAFDAVASRQQAQEEPSFLKLLDEPPPPSAHSPAEIPPQAVTPTIKIEKTALPNQDAALAGAQPEGEAQARSSGAHDADAGPRPKPRKVLQGQTPGRLHPGHPLMQDLHGHGQPPPTREQEPPGPKPEEEVPVEREGYYTVQIYEDQLEQLHNIFDHYCAMGYVQGAQRKMRLAQWIALLKDSGLVLDTPTQEDAKILYIESCAVKKKGGGAKTATELMSFEMFTYALTQLARRYISATCPIPEAIDQLLVNIVFPNAETKPDIMSTGIYEEGTVMPQQEVDALIIAAYKGSVSAEDTLRAAKITNVKVATLKETFVMFDKCLYSIFKEYAERPLAGTGMGRGDTINMMAMSAFTQEFNLKGRISQAQIDMAFRTCAETYHRDPEDKASYFGDDRPDCISYKAFVEFLLRCAMLGGASPAYQSLNPPQKLDILLYTMAMSKGFNRLITALSSNPSGKELHNMHGYCLRSVRQNKDVAPHIFNIDDVKDALGVDAEAYAQRIFDYYASYGNPTKVDVMGTGHFSKLCRDIKLFEILDPGVKESSPDYEVELDLGLVDILFKQNSVEKHLQQDKAAGSGRERLPPAGPTGGALDMMGFLTMLSEFGPLKYVNSPNKKEALKQLWERHVLPLAKTSSLVVEKEEDGLQVPSVQAVFAQFRKQMRAFFSIYSQPGKTDRGLEDLVSRSSIGKFFREFELLPSLVSQREATMVLKDACVRTHSGRGVGTNEPMATFKMFEDVVGRLARVAFGKHPHGQRYRTTLQRCEALFIYLDLSKGRVKAGLKCSAWVNKHLEKQEAEKLAAAATKKRAGMLAGHRAAAMGTS